MDQSQYWQKEKSDRIVNPQVEELPFLAKEAINALRGNIQLSGIDLKTIAITSARANEGKSTIAFQLAKSLSVLGKKTLFIDCDIRNSRTISRYGIDRKVSGLSEFLCGQLPLLETICRTDDQYFDMIFTGEVAPNPSELLSGPLFTRMLRYVRDKYDYVILDTPPILPVIDGTLISKQCDGTLLVVVSGVTERAQAQKALKQLQNAEIRVLGAVLNKVGIKRGGYGGRYYKGYYGGYDGYGYGDEAQEEKRAGH